MGQKAVKNKVNDVRKIISLLYTYAAPGHEDKLKAIVEGVNKTSSLDHDAIDFLYSTMERVKEAYLEAEYARGRKIALSLVSNRFNFKTISHFLPSVSRSMFFRSRQLDIFVDLVYSEPVLRERYNREKVKFFVEFLIRFDIMADLPHGNKQVELSDGKVLELNEMMKKHTNSHIIQLYEQHLERLNIFDSMKMSRSTYLKVIDAIPHRTTTAASCVDYFYSHAESGFDAICEIIDILATKPNSDQEDWKQLKKEVREGRIYLNGEFRMSIDAESTIFDYSAAFALSDPNDNDFKAGSMRAPIYRAEKCVKLEDTFSKVKRLFNENIEDPTVFDESKREIYKNMLNTSLSDIYELKKHYIRSFYTALTKIAILDKLEPGQALGTMDFAQKYLPQHYLEEQNVINLFKITFNIKFLVILWKSRNYLSCHSFSHQRPRWLHPHSLDVSCFQSCNSG